LASAWTAVRTLANQRLLALLIVLGITPLAGLAYSSITLATNAVGGRVDNEVHSAATGGALLLNQRLSDLIAQQEGLSHQANLVAPLAAGSQSDWGSLTADLPEQVDPAMVWSGVASTGGTLLVERSYGAGAASPSSQWIRQVLAADQPQLSTISAPGLFSIGTIIRNPGGPALGVLVLSYQTRIVTDLVSNYDQIAGTTIVIRDGSGATIAGPGSILPGTFTYTALLNIGGWSVTAEIPPQVAYLGIDRLRLIVIASAAVLALALMVGLVAFGQALISEQEGRMLSRIDQLTGLPNRRVWDDELPREAARARRSGQPLCLALIDLDHFKEFNDTFGHLAGDDLLATAGAAWAAEIRSTDLIARYGGEEFAVLLPNCQLDEAIRVLDRLRSRMPRNQTCSAGVAQWNPNEPVQEAMARADEALYSAKRTTRNRTVAAA
jgi:diguanylate cyclase (GGDEF)-like protein